jgi:type IV secretory pathway VirJ component
VVRQQPEEKLFSTGPQARFRALLYAPKAPETGRSAATPVIFYSGEWGWRPLQQDVASYLASTGRFVLGIDSTEYFASLVPATVLAADFEKFRGFVNERAGRPRNADVILIGFAMGAELIPYLLNETRAPGVKGAVLIAPDRKGVKVYRVTIQLKMDSPPEEQFDVGEELKRMAPLPVVLMEGTLDKDSAAKVLADAPRGPHKYVPIEGGDRQFHEVREGFFAVLLDALHWIDQSPIQTPP